MAGVREVCSHVAAVLFAAEGNTLIKRQFSATSLPYSWLPANFKFVSFSMVADIDFKTPTQKRKMALRNETTTCVQSLTLLLDSGTLLVLNAVLAL